MNRVNFSASCIFWLMLGFDFCSAVVMNPSLFTTSIQKKADLLASASDLGFTDDEIHWIANEKRFLEVLRDKGFAYVCTIDSTRDNYNRYHVEVIEKVFCGGNDVSLPPINRFSLLSNLLGWNVLMALNSEEAGAILGYDLMVLLQPVDSNDRWLSEAKKNMRTQVINLVDQLPGVREMMPASLIHASLLDGFESGQLIDQKMTEAENLREYLTDKYGSVNPILDLGLLHGLLDHD